MPGPAVRFRTFLAFSHGRVASDDAHASGVEIGRPKDSYRRVGVESTFGKVSVFVTDGHPPYPYGHEMTGYEVANLADTLAKAKAAGATVLVEPYAGDHRDVALVQFPGGFIVEIRVRKIDQTDALVPNTAVERS